MVVVPAAVEGAALATALVPFVLHRWDMYRWDKAHREHRPKGTTTASPFRSPSRMERSRGHQEETRQPRPPKSQSVWWWIPPLPITRSAWLRTARKARVRV